MVGQEVATGSAWFGAEHVLISQLRAQTRELLNSHSSHLAVLTLLAPVFCPALLASRRLEGTEKENSFG